MLTVAGTTLRHGDKRIEHSARHEHGKTDACLPCCHGHINLDAIRDGLLAGVGVIH